MDTGLILITLGVLLLLGLVTDLLGSRTPLPRVTLLLLFGFAIGPSVTGILSADSERWFPLIANMALAMVGFLLGEQLTVESLQRCGRLVFSVSVAEVVVTATIVATGLVLIGFPPEVGLLLGGIATATDPAATLDVTREAKADGPFTRTLLGVVAIDDAWGLITFSILLAAAHAVSGHSGGIEALRAGSYELAGAVGLGVGIGIPAAYLSGRIEPGEPTLVEALGIVFLCGGVAIWLGVSFLLAAMVLGTTVANLATHHSRPFHAIENIEWPFMILFFVLAGASLHFETLRTVGVLGAAYVLLRVVGRLLGGAIGAGASDTPPVVRRWMGLALLPQAGVAIGTGLIAAEQFPELAAVILPVVIGATALFEITGPVLTRRALLTAGETGKGNANMLNGDAGAS